MEDMTTKASSHQDSHLSHSVGEIHQATTLKKPSSRGQDVQKKSSKQLEKTLLDLKKSIQEISLILSQHPENHDKADHELSLTHRSKMMQNIQFMTLAYDKVLSCHETIKAKRHLSDETDPKTPSEAYANSPKEEKQHDEEEQITDEEEEKQEWKEQSSSLENPGLREPWIHVHRENIDLSPARAKEPKQGDVNSISTCGSHERRKERQYPLQNDPQNVLNELNHSDVNELESRLTSKSYSSEEGLEQEDNEDISYGWNIKPLGYPSMQGTGHEPVECTRENQNHHSPRPFVHEERINTRREKGMEMQPRTPPLEQSPDGHRIQGHILVKSPDQSPQEALYSFQELSRKTFPLKKDTRRQNLSDVSPVTLQQQDRGEVRVAERAQHRSKSRTLQSNLVPLHAVYGYSSHNSLSYNRQIPETLAREGSEERHAMASVNHPVFQNDSQFTETRCSFEQRDPYFREGLPGYVHHTATPQIVQGMTYTPVRQQYNLYTPEECDVNSVYRNVHNAQSPTSRSSQGYSTNSAQRTQKSTGPSVLKENKMCVDPNRLQCCDTRTDESRRTRYQEPATAPDPWETKFVDGGGNALYQKTVQPYQETEISYPLDDLSYPFPYDECIHPYTSAYGAVQPSWMTEQRPGLNMNSPPNGYRVQRPDTMPVDLVHCSQAIKPPTSPSEHEYGLNCSLAGASINDPRRVHVLNTTPWTTASPCPTMQGASRLTPATRHRAGYRLQKRANSEKSRHWSAGFDYIKRTFALC